MTDFHLSGPEVAALEKLSRRRKGDNLESKRACYLLALHEGNENHAICKILRIRPALGDDWRKRYEEDGLASIGVKTYPKRFGHLSEGQENELRTFLRAKFLSDTNEIRAHIRKAYGIHYSKSGCIKLMARLGFEYKKPKLHPVQAKESDQQDYLEDYTVFKSNLRKDEAFYYIDAVHPVHQPRPAYGWFYKGDKPVIPVNSGRQRFNIHGGICLTNFDLPFVTAKTINAKTFIKLLAEIEVRNPHKRWIHVIADNARYHHAKIVQEWLKRPGCRIKLRFLPPYCPHFNPIERLWGVMHKKVTHNRFYPTYDEFCQAIEHFLRETVPKDWKDFRDTVTDNFRIMTSQDCKIVQ